MTFELVPSRIGDLVARLRADAPEFFSSPHYEGMDDLPQVTLGAFARYLVDQHDPTTIAAGLRIIGEFLNWNCSEATEAVEEGFFAVLKDNDTIGTVLIPAMSDSSRSAYEKWSAHEDDG